MTIRHRNIPTCACNYFPYELTTGIFNIGFDNLYPYLFHYVACGTYPYFLINVVSQIQHLYTLYIWQIHTPGSRKYAYHDSDSNGMAFQF